jgi:hypothetical protein
LIWKKRPTGTGGGSKPGKVAGHVTKGGDTRIGIGRRQYSAKDLVWIMHNGPIPENHRVRSTSLHYYDSRLKNLVLTEIVTNPPPEEDEENFLSTDRAAVEQAFNRDQVALEHFFNKARANTSGDVSSFLDQEIGESIHEESSEEASYKMVLVSKNDVNKLIVSLEDAIKLLKDALSF